jgi:hypothetical protein
MLRTNDRHLLLCCALGLLLQSGCGLTGDRQVFYPKGSVREVDPRIQRRVPARAPTLELGVDDRPKAFPSTLGD